MSVKRLLSLPNAIDWSCTTNSNNLTLLTHFSQSHLNWSNSSSSSSSRCSSQISPNSPTRSETKNHRWQCRQWIGIIWLWLYNAYSHITHYTMFLVPVVWQCEGISNIITLLRYPVFCFSGTSLLGKTGSNMFFRISQNYKQLFRSKFLYG